MGCDSFDDFEVVMLVHEATYDQKGEKHNTIIRFTAGNQSVQTDVTSHGIFQQPLTLLVEQGTDIIVCDLMNNREKVLATLKFDPEVDLLRKYKDGCLPSEQIFIMKQKGKGLTNPKVKLTMVLEDLEEDCETGLLSGLDMSSDTRYMVKQQLQKVTAEGRQSAMQSEVQMLAHACSGPLDMFLGLGEAKTVHIGIVGPPHQRKHSLCVYENKHAFEKMEHAKSECELLKIRSVQSDPKRSNVFMVNYVDKDRVTQQLSFRRIDRNRDVWVEMLQLLIREVHKVHPDKKAKQNSH